LGLSRWESCTLGLHVLFEVVFKILEDEEQLLLTEQYFFKLDDVWMLQVFEERDSSDGSAWDTIVFLLKTDLFNSYEFTGLKVLCLVDNTICSLSELLQFLVFVEARCRFGDILCLSGRCSS
jgi:hypothetical protein